MVQSDLKLKKACEIFHIDFNSIHKIKLDRTKIKTKYRELCLKYHPDKSKGTTLDAYTIQDIKESYELLIKLYDYQLNEENENTQSRKNQETCEASCDAKVIDNIKNKMLSLFLNWFNIENLDTVIPEVLHSMNLFERKLITINYFISFDQVIEKQLFYNEEFGLYVPLWHQEIEFDLTNTETEPKEVSSSSPQYNLIRFVMKVHDLPRHIKILKNNDIIVKLQKTKGHNIGTIYDVAIGKCFKMSVTVTERVYENDYVVLFNKGVPRGKRDNIYDFSELSNVIICFV
jgi:hypothetical protein